MSIGREDATVDPLARFICHELQWAEEPVLKLAADNSHAALMDRIYGRQRHVYDVTRSVFLLGRNRLIDDLALPEGGCVLEIGCGTGRNLVAAAKRYACASFYGIDISSKMLKTARQSIAASPAAKRIVVAQGDALSFDPLSTFNLDKFDRIFFSYSLSMIPGWQKALTHATTMVSPGGKILVVDFGQCGELPAWFRSGLFSWLSAFHVYPCADLIEVMGSLSASCAARIEWQPLFRDYVWRVTLVQP